jgi:hypothetical protein
LVRAALRPAIETATVLHWVAESEQYSAFCSELTQKRFRRITYEAASAGLKGSVGDLPRIYGEFSNFGSHMSAPRLLRQSYRFEGEIVDRLGYSLNQEDVIASLKFVPAPLFQCLAAICLGYEQAGAPPPELERIDGLRSRYLDLKRSTRGNESPA